MRIRSGFVSNSSSASFIVYKRNITQDEAKILLDYDSSEQNIDGWVIKEYEDSIRGEVIMDNDALDEYLDKIQFDVRKMEWESCESGFDGD